MAWLQFQDGLSLSGFLKRYCSEDQCENAVRRWRWPNGFRKCGGDEHGIVGTCRLYECHACGRQTSLAGTIFAHTGEDIEHVARAHLAPSARVLSDGLSCFRTVTRAGCRHEPIVAAREPEQPEKIPAFRRVNTTEPILRCCSKRNPGPA